MVLKHSGMTALAAVILAGLTGGALAQDTTTGTGPSSASTQSGSTTAEPNPAVGYPSDPAATTGTAVDGTATTRAAGTDGTRMTTTTTETVPPAPAPDDDGGMDLGWLGLIGLAGLLGLRGRHDEHIRADNVGPPTSTR